MAKKAKKINKEDGSNKKMPAGGGIVLRGVVVGDKMDKTVVVSVSRFVKHRKYGKFYKIDKRYKAHDEQNKYKVGDKVEIVETKPLSKDKHFKVLT